mgnify:CR=1 FL=1
MDSKRFTRRLVALGAAMFLCALVFVVTLFDAQIVNGDDYLAQSIRTNAKSETVKASRGVITDRNGKVLVSNRAVYTLNFDSSLVSSDELNDALLRVIDLMNAQGVEIKDMLPLARTSPYAYDTANGSAKTLVKYLVSLKWINEKNVGDDGLPTTLTGSALYLKLRSEYGIDKALPTGTVRTLIGLRYSLASAKMNGSTTFEFASDVDVSLISLIKDGNYAGVQVDTSSVRVYETDYAAHVLGYTGSIQDWDDYKDKDGFALGEWIVYNRQRYLGGNLPSDRVERLEALGMVWDTGSILWEKSYAAAVQYYLENHTLEIPVKYVTPDGMALGVWLGSQRAAYKEGMLTDAQIEKLEALGVDWANRNDRKWQTAYEAAVKYHAAHGNLDVPIEYIDEDGILLGKWVSRQRYAWQNPERSSARVTLERKALLDELGMNWEKTDSWQHRYELAVEYKKEHGSLAVPAQYRTEDGIWLGSWLSRQKQMLREGKKLSAKRRAALKELFKGEKGRRLSAPVPPACSVREQNWLDNYQSARLYAEKKGSLLVPAGYVDENGFRLGVWISNLRAARKARPGSFQVTPEHIALLDAIGMQWDAREAKWAGAFRRAEEYRAAHGNLLVPVNYKTEDGFCLGDWVRRMRENYACAEKKLTAERIAKLEALGMVWTVPQEG